MYGVQYTVHRMAAKRSETSRASAARTNRPQLSADEILATAEELLRREGIESLSMRRLGVELDVWPMSVYRYFRNKDELLDALVDRAVNALPAAAPTTTWQEQLADLARDLAAAVASLTPALAPRFLTSPAAAELLAGRAQGPLQEAGLGPDQSAVAWEALAALVIGATTTERAAAVDFGVEQLLEGIAAAGRSG